jgi:uncharacterized protein (UPF0332 family)
MTGEQFLTVAAELAAGTTEAHHRSAVSRAYYGAFHVVRRLLEENGIRLPKGEQIHAKATYCLQDCGDANAARAADELVVLRGERNRADYDLDGVMYKQHVGKTQVERAQRIARTLGQCRSGPNAAEFRVKVRAQAKLLGLPVSP